MDARITAIHDVPSKTGGKAFRICLSSNENPPRSYKSYVYERCTNYVRWYPVIQSFRTGHYEIVLKGLNVFRKGYADADSEFFMIKRPVIQEASA